MRIIHVFRAPIGGLFRHVIDLVKEQSRRGHEIGIFCDSTFAGERNEKLLKDLEGHLKLGLVRSEMHRNPHLTDLVALQKMRGFCKSVKTDVIHGHGSKGGLYARVGGLWPGSGPVRAYTPHGGSLNYRPGTPLHKLYMVVERVLERGTGAFLFESQFIADRFYEFVGTTDAVTRIVLNGLHPEELEPILPQKEAMDFLYIGEYRFAKGIDTMLEAMGRLRDMRKRIGKPSPTLLLVGQGPDEPALLTQVAKLKLDKDISFRKPMAAREAFCMANTMIVPSRFESMPYVVIEAAGASVPMISTDVGGIPEIFGEERNRLLACDDVDALVEAMAMSLDMTQEERLAPAKRLSRYIAENFSVSKMTDTVIEAYEAAMSRSNSSWVGQAAKIQGNADQTPL